MVGLIIAAVFGFAGGILVGRVNGKTVEKAVKYVDPSSNRPGVGSGGAGSPPSVKPQ